MFLRLFSQFILRSMWRERARSLIAVIGISLGVAVIVAIRLANDSVTDTFRAAVDSVSGQASLRIRGMAGQFDEQRFADLDFIRSFGQLSPVVEAYAMVGRGGAGPGQGSQTSDLMASGEIVHVLGVDVLLDFPLRDYRVLRLGEGTEQTAREAFRLLDDSRSVILTEKFLRRQGLKVGEDVELTFGSEALPFRIRGVLLDEGPARTLDGNFALTDIATAQFAAGRLGVLDYVDVLLPEGVDPDKTLAAIQARLPAGLRAELPSSESGRADTMIAAFQFNLTALSAVALIVGLFLIYNTVSMSVAARRAEIGMLQAVGANRRTVLALFLTEAAALSILGVLLGLPLGRMLGSTAVVATAQTVETFYIAAVAQSSAAALRLTMADVAMAFVVVVPLALLGAMRPAWEASSVQPVAAVRGSDVRLSARGMTQVTLGGLLCLACGWALTWGKPIDGRPLLGFLAEMMLMLGGALLTPLMLRSICKGLNRVARWSGARHRTELGLAAANLEGELPRVSVSVAALGVSLSMMIAIGIMVGSFRETVVYWLDSALSADLAVKPVIQSSSVSEARLSKRACNLIADDPDVMETVWFSARQIPFRDRKIRLAVTEIDKTLRRDRLIFKSRAAASFGSGLDSSRGSAAPADNVPADNSPADNAPADNAPADIFVSESFSLLFDADSGSTLQLPTPAGERPFHVAGVYYDYASNQGSVLLDLSDYQLAFGSSDPEVTAQNLSVYLKPDADVQSVRRRLLQQLGEREQVYCVTSSEVRTEALKIFESTFAITYALQFIAIFVAGLGVATTLIALIYQRQRDIGLLSLIGATLRQIRRVVVYEAVILGVVSQLIGIFVGVLLALVLIYVINVQSFGWTIQFHLPVQFILQSTLLVVAAAAMFGLYPATRAASIDALKTVREEHA